VFNGTFTHVEVLQSSQRREVLSLNGGTVKCVSVEVQLHSAWRYAGRDGLKAAS